jgi:hypothetical protein
MSMWIMHNVRRWAMWLRSEATPLPFGPAEVLSHLIIALILGSSLCTGMCLFLAQR